MNTVNIKLDTLDRSLQIRAALDGDTVEDYAAIYEDGAATGNSLPPPVVYRNEAGQSFLADGYHRVKAAESLGIVELPCDVRVGSRSDAQWFAIGANRTNGRRLSRGDVARAIRIALDEYPGRSQLAIAQQVGCSREWVNRVANAGIGGTDEAPAGVNTSQPADVPAHPEAGIDGDGETVGRDADGAPGGRASDLALDMEAVDDACKTIAERAAYLEAMQRSGGNDIARHVAQSARQFAERFSRMYQAAGA